jgi:DNA-binding CsgD family transcriptional regulator
VLTAREREVLSMLVEGFSNKEVGERLELSLKTVETHRARIMFKTDATSFAELVRLALIAQSNEKK